MSRFYDALARATEDETVEAVPEAAPTSPPARPALARVAPTPSPAAAPAPPRRGPRTWSSRASSRPTAPVDREYERLAQRLHSLPHRDGAKVLLVASAVRGEGASTVARHLARALTHQADANLLLVDANLRSPSQHQAFAVGNTGGLTDVVTGRAALAEGIRSVPRAGHHLLPCGQLVGNVPQLLGYPALTDTLRELRRRYEWIVIDAPPVTQYPDAASLARACDGVVLVLKAESTRWQVAEEARRLIEEAGGRLLGAVLNERRYHIPEFLYKRL